MSDENSKSGLEIANLYAHVGADVKEFSAGMQAADRDLAKKRIAELGLDVIGAAAIVSYTSEELDQLPDESDYEAAAAMTDEEIEAAIASDPDENRRSPDWLKRARADKTAQ